MITAERLVERLRAGGQACIGDLFTDEAGVQFLTGIKNRTLRDWRARRQGPPATELHRWVYDIQALADWLNSKTHRQEDTKSGNQRREVTFTTIDAAERAG